MRTVVAQAALLAAALLAAVGCGGSTGGSEVHVPELGLTMKLPSGWVVDRQNPRMFFERGNRDDHFGMVEAYPLEGKTLVAYVDALSMAGGKLFSKEPVKIGGHDAFELVSGAAYTIIEVNIRKGDRVIRVSFRALKQEYPRHEAAMRAALRSIALP